MVHRNVGDAQKEYLITMRNVKVKFNFERFQKQCGKQCPCKIAEAICPCPDFLETRECICKLFTEEE